ncbi:MAG: DUF429 domain-containing protein, partial [Aestuariivirga sp.]
MTPVMGVDGCPGGWIAVIWGAAPMHRLVSRFSDLLDVEAAVIAVDMPIGLPESHGRPPEREVRCRLGERQSSVFAVPARPAVMSEDYREACAINLQHSDPPRKIAKQSFHLFPKIREIDAIITPGLQSRVFEVHPELAFWAMNGEQPLSLPKKTKGRPDPAGQALRRDLLRRAGFPL